MNTENDTINEEIRKFIETTTKPENIAPKTINQNIETKDNEIKNLIFVLDNLHKIYSKINDALIIDDTDKLKTAVFGTDVKMNMVCESLLKVLRDVCVERNDYKQNKTDLLEKIENLENEKDLLTEKLHNFEQKNLYATNGNNELNRVIKDQKERIKSYRDKANIEKKTCDDIKTLNIEIETSKNKVLEKNKILEKEISILNSRLKEKADEISEFKLQVKSKEIKENEFKNKNIEISQELENTKHKLDTKDKALDVCNSELARLISKDKKINRELHTFKDKSNYYERLYQSVSKQNEYLNEQLTRILNLNNIHSITNTINDSMNTDDKILDTKHEENNLNLEKMKANFRKIKRKLKSYKSKYSRKNKEIDNLHENYNKENNEIQRMANEIKKLREENQRVLEKNKKMTENYISKMEDLVEKNKQYQNKIIQLRAESISDIKDVTSEKGNFNYYFDEKPYNFKADDFKNFYNLEDYKDEDLEAKKTSNFFEDHKFKEKSLDSESFEYENIDFNPKKLIDLSIKSIIKQKNKNDYTKMKGALSKDYFDDLSDAKIIEEVNHNQTKQNQVDNNKETNNNPKEISTNDKNSTEKISQNSEKQEKNDLNFSNIPSETYKWKDINKDSDSSDSSLKNSSVSSDKSTKSVHTTSTLKEMIENTEKMKQKFNELDEKLNSIKNSNKNLPEKLHNQIQEYTNYYYTDFLELENDPNFL